jgi:hypothetical protein
MDLNSHRQIAPAEGRRVRHENGALLDPMGEGVAWSPWWARRLADGDIEEVGIIAEGNDADAKKKGK